MVNKEGYIFAYFNNTGNGWIVNSTDGTALKIISGELPVTTDAGQVAAIPYMGGFLVVSVNGHYWDYNLTAADTLTENSGGIASFTSAPLQPTPPPIPGWNYPPWIFQGGDLIAQNNIPAAAGVGGEFQSTFQAIAALQINGGSGYVVGDTLIFTDGQPTTPAQAIVTAIDANGGVANANLTVAGAWPGPTSSTPVQVGPNPNVSPFGGHGTNARFILPMQSTGPPAILKPGHSYVPFYMQVLDTTSGHVIEVWNANVGFTSGNAIATYAGRVWIGDGFQVYVTDINSYNSFGGAGTSFTVSDSYFTGTTALFSANNYLYLFSADSVDVISNVTVAGPGTATAGTTSFTRINVLQGIGCAFPQVNTLCGFARGVAFMDITGYYLLAGATPERVSDRWQAVVRTLDFATLMSAGVFDLNNELCLGVTVQFLDKFSTEAAPRTRTCTFVFQRHRWWVHSTTYQYSSGTMAAIPTGVTTAGLYQWVTNGGIALLRIFGGQSFQPWLMRTKLWDGAAAFREKQSINVALAAIWTDPIIPTGVTFEIDSELYNSPAVEFPVITHPGGYNYALQVFRGAGASQAWGSQFIGLTFVGDGTNVNVLEGLALRGKQERNMLE
jgi:hypothetical protein